MLCLFVILQPLSNLSQSQFSLAYAELHIAIAAVIRQFGHCMSLFQTTTDNVELAKDFFVPWPKGEKSVQVLVN